MTRKHAILPILDNAITSATNTKHSRSANALKDARNALKQEPPNTTGVVNHAIDALEGVLTKTYATHSMDQVLRRARLTGTGRRMLSSHWKFANEHARHLLEATDDPSFDDAIFQLHSVCAIMRTLGSMHCICCNVSSLIAEFADDKCARCSSSTHGCNYCDYEAQEYNRRYPACVDTRFITEERNSDGSIHYRKWCGPCGGERVGVCDDPAGYNDEGVPCDAPEMSHPHTFGSGIYVKYWSVDKDGNILGEDLANIIDTWSYQF